jgi:hypothetical protein
MKSQLLLTAAVAASASNWPHPRQPHETSVPASFDCAMRKLAYKFGQKLLPRKDKFESLFYALDLNTPCDGEPAMEMHSPEPALPRPEPEAPEPAANAVYVSPEGSDAAAGTKAAPFQTIQHALDAAAAAKSASVILRKGVFYLDAAILVGATHSGIAVSAYAGESPVISGGKALETAWKPFKVSNGSFAGPEVGTNIVHGSEVDNKTIADYGTTADAAACQAACSKGSAFGPCTGYTWHDSKQGKFANLCRFRLDGKVPRKAESGHTSGWVTPGLNIYQADLTGQVGAAGVPGLQMWGADGSLARATRARFPNLPGGLEASCGYDCMVPSGSAAWTPPDMNKYGPVEFYTDNTSAHHRNDTVNWFNDYMIGTKGLCSVYDPPVSYWCSQHPSGGGAFAFRTPSGMTPSKGALPNMPYKQHKTAILNVWRPSRWANWMFEV